jgi:hypothetical protein
MRILLGRGGHARPEVGTPAVRQNRRLGAKFSERLVDAATEGATDADLAWHAAGTTRRSPALWSRCAGGCTPTAGLRRLAGALPRCGPRRQSASPYDYAKAMLLQPPKLRMFSSSSWHRRATRRDPALGIEIPGAEFCSQGHYAERQLQHGRKSSSSETCLRISAFAPCSV